MTSCANRPPAGSPCPSVFRLTETETKHCTRPMGAGKRGIAHQRHEWRRTLPQGGVIVIAWTEVIEEARV